MIPVIDLKQGAVVRAVGGDRTNYKPVKSPLAPGTDDPFDVVAGLIDFFAGFNRLYVADLDGIEGGRRDQETVRRISSAFPKLQLLVDNGSANASDVKSLALCPRTTPVIGSETLGSVAELERISDRLNGAFALSLDWRGEERLGPLAVFEDPSNWPDTLIVMTLDRVGRGAGPGLDRLKAIKQRAADREVLAAGGVRNIDDLRLLRRLGCGALVASCLHDGSVSCGDLTALLE